MFTPEREMAPLNHAFSSVGVRKHIVCLTFAPGLFVTGPSSKDRQRMAGLERHEM